MQTPLLSLGDARPPSQGSLNVLEMDQLPGTLLVSNLNKHRPYYHPQGFHGHDLIGKKIAHFFSMICIHFEIVVLDSSL
jgi:hypothetical protein